MARTNDTTRAVRTERYICGYAACPGVMNATVTMAGERCYECCHCGHTAMAHLVETDNAPLPDGYGARIRALIDMAMCDADIAARAILETHRVAQ